MPKKILGLLTMLTTLPLFAMGSRNLDSFDFLSLGMSYETLNHGSVSCDQPMDIPGFADSLKLGVSSTVCPAAETFAMATFLDKKMVTVAVNWVSWDAKKLTEGNSEIAQIPSDLRRKFGIPNVTLPYESQFGNRDADKICLDQKKMCQMHIWKSEQPERVAKLIYMKVNEAEVPLLFHLSDVTSERRIAELKAKSEHSPRPYLKQ